TAAAAGQIGQLRRDPFAMLPFCGYNMGDYFGHWLNVGKRLKHPPKIYSVNWFRTDENGKFIWPGFGDNIRVIKWILDRVNGRVGARETPIGLVPNVSDLDLSGLNIAKERMEKLFEIDRAGWRNELRDIDAFLAQFGNHMPAEIRRLRDDLAKKLG
ncbi:MAG TPA: phosphoenolpyruvate carboxykinase domain-containing protein, partial [Sedimentisphaerales bacterium]|nr:phosphoenolpyruvate carboxykinase domain-containing protein [Sedimentisphaerales bacterium]